MLGARACAPDSRALRIRTPQAGVMQFKDLNADKSAFQRTYANQARAFRHTHLANASLTPCHR